MKRAGLARRTFLRRLGSVSLMADGGIRLLRPRISVAAPVTLSLWSGSGGNIGPFYKMAADEYAKTHPGFALEVEASLPPREFEQKLKAAMSSDTGPDLFDAGRLTTL